MSIRARLSLHWNVVFGAPSPQLGNLLCQGIQLRLGCRLVHISMPRNCGRVQRVKRPRYPDLFHTNLYLREYLFQLAKRPARVANRPVYVGLPDTGTIQLHGAKCRIKARGGLQSDRQRSRENSSLVYVEQFAATHIGDLSKMADSLRVGTSPSMSRQLLTELLRRFIHFRKRPTLRPGLGRLLGELFSLAADNILLQNGARTLFVAYRLD